MLKTEYTKFKSLWLSSCALYPGRNPSDESVSLAFGVLAAVEFNDVKRALIDCLKTSRYMPTPAEVVEKLVGGSFEDRARLVWVLVREYIIKLRSDRSVRFEDAAAQWAVKALGGWVELCRMDSDKAEPLFCRYYVTALRTRPSNVPDHLPGTDELRQSTLYPWRPDDIVTIGTRQSAPMIEAAS